MDQQKDLERRHPVSVDDTWSDLLVFDRPTPNTYRDAESIEIMRQHTELGRHLGALAVARAAQRHGAAVEWISKSEAWAVLNDRRIPIIGHLGTESAVGASIVTNKQMAEEIMHAAGVAVPLGRLVSSAAEAVRAQVAIGGPVVVKPRNGTMGTGVTVNVRDAEHVRQGYRRARKVSRNILVEPYIRGPEYRAHATPAECVGIFRRLLPTVAGDGRSTIGELIQQKNRQRAHNPTTRLHPIRADDVTEDFLGRHGLTLGSVLPADVAVVVRDVNGLTSGGESEGCFDTVEETVKMAAVAAVAAIPGMDWAGVDLIVDEASGVPYVIEVNADAAMNGSTFPVYGDAQDVGSALWQRMHAQSLPDPRGRPVLPRVESTPRPVDEDAPSGSTGELTLRDLLQAEQRRRGMRVMTHGPRVWSATNAETMVWFRDSMGVADQLTSTRPLRRRRQLRRILRTMNVRQPVGREVRSVECLSEFRSDVGGDVMLVSMRGVPASARPTVIGPSDEVEPGMFRRRTWFAQRYQSGSRYRVVATSAEALLVTAPHGQGLPDPTTVQAAARLAVRTVRAVPQLRWAAVDIVVCRSAARRRSALVEDVTQSPIFDRSDEIVAGSFGGVFELLLAERQPVPAPDQSSAWSRQSARARHLLRRMRSNVLTVRERLQSSTSAPHHQSPEPPD